MNGRSFLVAAAAVCWILTPIASRGAITCGNGSLDGGEECDHGTVGLFIDGDPSKAPCSGGSRCYFRNTCCKFNCQYVGTPGSPCEDGNTCTDPDSCDQVGNCLGGPPASNGMPCDDGLFCTGEETCSDGVCAHSGDPCPGTACNRCNEADRSCFDPSGTSCSDGSVCVTGGTCDGAGGCVGGVFNNGPCDDGLYCNGSDTCEGGACIVHSGDPCPGADGDANCDESCDEQADSCTAADTDGSACDDGLFCDGAADSCRSGICSGSGTVICDDGNDCTLEACNETLDLCATIGSAADGTACDDRDLCTIGDQCVGGICSGSPTMLQDFCPWTVVLREQPNRDLIRTYFKVSIDGDVCGGSLRLYGQTHVTSDVVCDESEGERELRLAPDVIIGDDIISAGAGAIANPSMSFLPYVDPPASELPPRTLLAKHGASGTYDLTGLHPLVHDCHAARLAYPHYTADIAGLLPTATVAAIRLGPGETAAIHAAPAAVNVVDVDGSLLLGKAAVLTLDGGGSTDTVIVLRVPGKFRLLADAAIELDGGMTPEHALIAVAGKKCILRTQAIGAGTLLCSPGRFVARDTTAWIGAVFGDGTSLRARQRASFHYAPFRGF